MRDDRCLFDIVDGTVDGNLGHVLQERADAAVVTQHYSACDGGDITWIRYHEAVLGEQFVWHWAEKRKEYLAANDHATQDSR